MTEAQLRAVKQRAEAGEDPWATALSAQVAAADVATKQPLLSVTDDGAPAWENEHRFGQDETRHDYRAARKMTSAARDAGLGYWFTGTDEYARTVIDIVHHWCLNEETGMAPVAENLLSGTGIALWVTVPDLWYGASLVGDHPYWRGKTGSNLQAGFREWVRAFVESVPDPGYRQHNNIWAWRIQTIAGAADYLGDDGLFERALSMWRAERPWLDYRRMGGQTGALEKELGREDGLGYHVYGTKALTMTAEIARHRGIDLYSYNAPTDPESGSTLRKLYNFMVPYLKDTSKWKWGVGSDGVSDVERQLFASLYELGYSRWEDPQFEQVVRLVGRPVHDGRLLGCTSLTHGNLFELDYWTSPGAGQ